MNAAPAVLPACNFELLDASGRPLNDPRVEFTFMRPSGATPKQMLALAGSPVSFTLKGFDGQAVFCEIGASRFRPVKSAFMLVSPGRSFMQKITVPRNPRSWKPAFTKWKDLSSHYEPFKELLAKSKKLRLKATGETIGTFAKAAYDTASDSALVLAKTALLNLHRTLSDVTEPVGKSLTWLSFLREIVMIDRERLVASVDPAMVDIVRIIHRDIEEYEDTYKRAPATMHKGNIPAELRDKIQDIVSIKTREKRGNLQLTVATFHGLDTVLLDADVDEHGEVVPHLFDALVLHKFTGGTHPIDVHECIRAVAPNVDLGYTLV